MNRKLLVILSLFLSWHFSYAVTVISHDFEASNNGWTTAGSVGGTVWNRLVSPAPFSAGNATNVWAINPFNSYTSTSGAYVTSSALDFSAYNTMTLSVDVRYTTEVGFDGMNLYYSTDGGTTWAILGTTTSGTNWYNDLGVDGINDRYAEVVADPNGWAGDNTTWQTASHVLPAALDGAASVLFRIYFGSDASVADMGAAFDNFIITGTATCTVVAGTATGTTTVCSSSTANLSLLGQDGGTTLQWQSSADNSTWVNVTGGSGTTTSAYTTAAITANTYFRCAVTNGCTTYSNSQLITVDATSVGGTSLGSTGLCSDGTTVLTLSGTTGTIQWEESTDQSIWVNETGGVGGVTSSYTTEILTSTRYYRAAVTNGTCVVDYSAIVTVTHSAKPTTQASAISFTSITSSSMTVNWTRGDGAKVLIIAKVGSAPTDPIDGVSYVANATYSSGDIVGGGFAVYNGTGASVNITGLTGNATYHFAIYEFNGACYHLTQLTGNQLTALAMPYVENFNGSTGIWINSSPSAYDWVLGTSGTAYSSNTGPLNSQEGSGYIFTEASSGADNDEAYLSTASFSLSGYTEMQFHFYYHMYGATIGELSVQASSDGGTTWSGNLWGELAGQQQTSEIDTWQEGVVDLSTYAGNLNVSIRFMGRKSTSFTGDIAVDNISLCNVTPGTLSGITTVCSGNSTVLSIAGFTASSTFQWEKSTNGVSSWTNVTGGSGATTSTYTTPNLATLIYYRCKVTNGCSSYSSVAQISIDTSPVAGTSGGSGAVCAGTTKGLTLFGQTGTIQWEESTDQSIWANETGGVGGSTTAYTTENLTTNRYYRAKLTNGVCAAVYAANVTVTVDAVSVGGTGGGSTTICGATASNLNVSGTTGSLQWQRSTDNVTFTNIAGQTGTSYTTTALVQTTYYRVAATSGVCNDYSSHITVTFNASSVGGTATTSAATICATQAINLSLAGNTGTLQWQNSIDGGATWSNISGATVTPIAVTVSTVGANKYRASVTSGVCATVFSTTATVTAQECMKTTVNTDCSFILYDSGGSGGNYGNNESLKYTVCPDDPSTQRIVVTFNNFISQVNVDVMRIYDGADVFECKVFDFSGNHGVGLSATPYEASQANSSGCLTLFWNTSSVTNYAGWDATISCQAVTVAPTGYDCPPSCDINADKAGEDCANAPLVSSLTGYCGTTWDSSYPDPSNQNVPGGANNYYTPTATPSTYGGTNSGISWDNSSYIKFVAGATTVAIDYWVDENPYALGGCTADGIQLILHEAPNGNCSGWNQTGEIGNNWEINPTGTANIGTGKSTWTVNGLTIGNTYYIAIDGYAGRTCQYSFQASSGIATCNINITTHTEVCNGDGTFNVEILYTGGAGSGTTYYVDDLDNGGVTNTGSNLNSVASGTIIMGPYYNNSAYNINITGGNQGIELCNLSVVGTTNACAITACADADDTGADGAVACGTPFNLSYTNTTTTVYTLSQTSCSPTLYPHTTGTTVTLSDDAVSANLNIGFSFDFFGTAYTQFRIHSNGIISFGGETYTGYTSKTIPTTSIDNFVAGCYRDLDPRAVGSTIRYETTGSAPTRKLIVTYQDIGLYNQLVSTTTFQIVLEETTNCVKIHTIDYPDKLDSWSYNQATQGIQSGTNSFVPPGRNWNVWGGIVPANNDCVTLCPVTTGGCAFQHWENDLGANVGTANPLAVTPGSTTTYYAVFDCAGATCKQPQTVSVTGTCASCDLKDYVYAPDGGIAVTNSECTATNSWTHYFNSANPNEILFSIFKNGNNLTGTTVSIEVKNGGTDFLSKTNATNSVYLLRRAWNVAAAGPDYNVVTGLLTNPIKIRFYYRPWEKQIVVDSAFTQTTAGGGTHGSAEDFYWYKSNDGVAYTHESASFSAVSVTNTYNLTVTSTGTTNTQNQTNYIQIDNITGFSGGSGFRRSLPGVPLPIELIDFRGVQKGKVNNLFWRTALEINLSYFVIQKSSNSKNDFTDLIKVLPIEGESILKDYEVIDDTPEEVTFYRLKSVDVDGAVSYSSVIIIYRKVIIGGEINVFPNPTKGDVNILFSAYLAGKIEVQLTDLLGKQLIAKNYSFDAGPTTIVLSLQKFRKGVYYITIIQKGDRLVEKIIIE